MTHRGGGVIEPKFVSKGKLNNFMLWLRHCAHITLQPKSKDWQVHLPPVANMASEIITLTGSQFHSLKFRLDLILSAMGEAL